MLPIVIASGAVSFAGKAVLQMGGGTVPVSKAFSADNSNNPGDMNALVFVPFDALVTALDGGSPDVGFAGVVSQECIAQPVGSGFVTLLVDLVQDADMVTWVNGVCTQSVQWVFPDAGLYTIQISDGVTTSTVEVNCS